MPKILVVGSLSMDYVVETQQIPQQGETVFGTQFKQFFGGKGANQAVAARRAGVEVAFCGAVGDDLLGQQLINNLADNQIETDHVAKIPASTSGTAHITLFEGDNRIIVVPAANQQLTASFIQQRLIDWEDLSMVILQNEIPQTVNRALIDRCCERGIPVLYNPAPVTQLDSEIIGQITYLTPNEEECKVLFSELSIEEAVQKYPNQLIVTLGAQGAIYHDGQAVRKVPAMSLTKEQVLDTTGAGDTFNGAFAAAICRNLSLEAAVQFANHAAGLSVQQLGAQTGMPYLDAFSN